MTKTFLRTVFLFCLLFSTHFVFAQECGRWLEGLVPVRNHPHELEGPIEMHPSFPYLGEHFPATVYYLNTKGLKIPVVFPSINEGFADFSPTIFHLLLSMPHRYIHVLHELRLNPIDLDPVKDANGDLIHVLAMANSEMKSIDLTPAWIETLHANPTLAIQVFGHEFGHLLAYEFFGSSEPTAGYAAAVAQDGNQISEYGATSLIEDWAEAIDAYFRLGDSARRIYPHRFAFIDPFFD